jgi:type I restriction enzyme, S subunit
VGLTGWANSSEFPNSSIWHWTSLWDRFGPAVDCSKSNYSVRLNSCGSPYAKAPTLSGFPTNSTASTVSFAGNVGMLRPGPYGRSNMSFPRYPKYKASGVEWLGEVPEHWTTLRFSAMAAAEPRSFVDGDWIEAPFITDHGVRLLQTGNIGIGAFREQGFRFISEQTFDDLKCNPVTPGDVLICRLAEPVGRACLAPDIGVPMVTSVDVCILRTGQGVHPSFVVYLCSSAEYLGYMEGQCRGGTRDRISRSFLGALRVVLPRFSEQSTIAAFLDRETAKIDALVAEQRQLMELLKEKRQAVISHAVTKGLNPDAPMKPSGVEWLGNVPAHWIRTELKRVTSVRGRIGFRGYTSEDLVDEGCGALVLGGANLALTGQLDLSKRTFLSWHKYEESPEIMVGMGDLIVGQRGTCGTVVHIDRDIAPATINPSLVLLKQQQLNSAFLCFWLMGSFVQSLFASYLNSTAIPMLSQEQIGNVVVYEPPAAEQVRIAASISVRLTKIDTLVEEVKHAIVMLEERRTALISAAVTGLIDVRHLAAEAA